MIEVENVHTFHLKPESFNLAVDVFPHGFQVLEEVDLLVHWNVMGLSQEGRRRRGKRRESGRNVGGKGRRKA